jgi:hypothetical protein
MSVKSRTMDEVKQFNTEYCLKLKKYTYKTTDHGQECLKPGSY